jgi:monoterpene epsilon-lactone hydrolase
MPRHIRLPRVCVYVIALSTVALMPSHSRADGAPPDFATIAASENAANAQPGPRTTPAKVIPVPDDVSPEMQAVIANPFRAGFWTIDPKSPEEWKQFVARSAEISIAPLAGIRDKLGVTMQETTIDGVHAYILQPKTLPAINANRLLVHVHGGGYTNSPGEAATGEAALLAGYGGFKVISVDYRMPPDYPYPAALDDAMTVYRAALKMQKPQNIAVFGLSTGGGLTLAMMLRAKAEGLPMPAAIGPGTPWSDLTETGDSYQTNQFVDNVLVAHNGWLKRAAALYANGHDLRDPMLSPIYGDMHGFPPTILTSGTRDLFLSNTVRVDQKLRQSGVETKLLVYEGQSHAQFDASPFSPECRDYNGEVAKFFDAHLGR